MSEQNDAQSSIKQHRSRETSTANKQNGKQAHAAQHPAHDNREAWKAYWKAQGQPWRTELEIGLERQEELQRHRSIIPDVEKGIYPFKGMKLNRADVEWLLATHDAGCGPVEWDNKQGRERWGLDVRGADLCHADLHELPLARLRGGLESDEYDSATEDQRNMAILLMEEADLAKVQLNGANLRSAQLMRTNFREAQLKETFFWKANLKGADFYSAKLRKANLGGVLLQGADLSEADLMRTNLRGALLQGANLSEARLKQSFMFRAQLEGADLGGALLEEAFLYEANFIGADLRGAQLRGAFLTDIKLGNEQHVGPLLADVEWGETNLAVIDWSQVTKLGDEWEAERKLISGKKKERLMGWERPKDYQAAVRANRQLAIALQNQGLNEDAARFNYHAQLLQRKVFWYERKFGQVLFLIFLDLLAGYGYKPWRSFLTYLIVITAFATAYFTIGHIVGPSLSPLGSFVFSMTSFHGRGFFPGGIKLDDPLTVLAALEAFVGLLIEVTFIATLTQRLFRK